MIPIDLDRVLGTVLSARSLDKGGGQTDIIQVLIITVGGLADNCDIRVAKKNSFTPTTGVPSHRCYCAGI